MEATEKTFVKRIFSNKAFLFSLSYLVYILISLVQKQAGEFVMQGSGDLNSVTSYDYILPMISSASAAVTLGLFLAAGYFGYNSDKVKMLRFPMAFCLSVALGSLCSAAYSSFAAVPFLEFLSVHSTVTELISVGVGTVATALLFLYFNSEKQSDYYYSEYYVDNPRAYKSLRNKILSHRFSTLWIVLIVCVGADIVGGILRSALTAAIVLVPDEYIWLGSCIDAFCDVVTCVLYFVFAWYFARSGKNALKLVALIFFASQSMNAFSFVINSITNVFAAAGDNLLNSVFSTIFVMLASSAISILRLVFLLIVCSWLKKRKED